MQQTKHPMDIRHDVEVMEEVRVHELGCDVVCQTDSMVRAERCCKITARHLEVDLTVRVGLIAYSWLKWFLLYLPAATAT